MSGLSGDEREAWVAEIAETLGEMTAVAWDFFPDPDMAIEDVAHALIPAVERIVAQREAAAGARALREAAEDPALRLSGHSGVSIRGLRSRADRIEGEGA